MTWKDRMNAGIGEYLRSIGVDAIEVTGYNEEVDVYSWGGCETCGPEKDFELSIYYKDSTGKSRTYTYANTFTEFLNNIT